MKSVILLFSILISLSAFSFDQDDEPERGTPFTCEFISYASADRITYVVTNVNKNGISFFKTFSDKASAEYRFNYLNARGRCIGGVEVKNLKASD